MEAKNNRRPKMWQGLLALDETLSYNVNKFFFEQKKGESVRTFVLVDAVSFEEMSLG